MDKQDTDQNQNGRQVNTQGGTYIEGNLNINPSATGEADLKAYLRSLALECSKLPLGLLDEQFANKNPLSLKDVYIDLDVLGVQLDSKKELHLLQRELEQARGSGRVPLLRAIAEEEAKRIVLLGVAGSGKTTFIHYLTYLLARAYAEEKPSDLPKALRGLVPVRLVLRKVAAHIPLDAGCGKAEMLWNALAEDLKNKLGQDGAERGLDWLKQEMQAGRSLLLLDGLDEVPEAGRRRACLLQAIEEFLSLLPEDQRVILTARPYAYADPAWQLRGCDVLNLAPLNLQQVERFVQRWCKWLVGVMERSELPARERVEAGNLLAKLGDARFDPDCCYLSREELLGFVRIPGGAFLMGSDSKRDPEARETEQPQHCVEVSEFYIQRYPVTVAQFRVFAEQSGYMPKDLNCLKRIANHPVANVTRNDALAYCKWLDGRLREKGPEGLRGLLAAGKQIRLPTEAKWEKAARGTDGRVYPWGDVFDKGKTNTLESKIGRTSPVGSFPGGASPYGVLDLSGNVWEWCADWYDERYYRKPQSINPPGPKYGDCRVLRGGSFGYDPGGARCAYRLRYSPDADFNYLGFRAGCSPSFSR